MWNENGDGVWNGKGVGRGMVLRSKSKGIGVWNENGGGVWNGKGVRRGMVLRSGK